MKKVSILFTCLLFLGIHLSFGQNGSIVSINETLRSSNEEEMIIESLRIHLERLNRYLEVLSSKNDQELAPTRKKMAYELALNLFVSSNEMPSYIEVSTPFLDKGNSKKFAVEAYLRRIEMLPYDMIHIQWDHNDFRLNPRLKQVDENRFIGTAKVISRFSSPQGRTSRAYEDITTKEITFLLYRREKKLGGKKVTVWDTKFINVQISQNR